MNEYGAKQDLADFIGWACGSLYIDEEMVKIVELLCDSLTINDTSLFFDLKCIVDSTCQQKCKDVMSKTGKVIKKRRVVEGLQL